MATKVAKKAAKPAKSAGKAAKSVYFFGNGKAEGMSVAKDENGRKMILGGKGAGLASMTSADLPVPPGFTISIPECANYYKSGKKLPESLKAQVRENMAPR